MASKPSKKIVKTRPKTAAKPAPKALAKKKNAAKPVKREVSKAKTVEKKKVLPKGKIEKKIIKKTIPPKGKAAAKPGKELKALKAKDKDKEKGKKKLLKEKELAAKGKKQDKLDKKDLTSKPKVSLSDIDEKSATDIRDTVVATVTALADDYSLQEIFESIKKIDFFNSETDECWEKGCDNPVTTHGYCRLHYIKNWNEIKKKHTLLVEGKLQEMIQELISKYPLKYIEEILNDMKDEKSFYNVLRELDIDSSEEDFEEVGGEGMEDDQDIAFETRVGSFKGILSEDE
jgi:hypothetical protein